MSMSPEEEARIIEKTVTAYMKFRNKFTSVDIGNDIKTNESTFIRNRRVAQWLRDNATNLSMEIGLPYDMDQIEVIVDGDPQFATLYIPTGIDPSEYTDIEQSADAPSDDQLNDDDDTTVPDVIFYTPTPRVIAADRFKHPISVGDTICYPVRQGSMMWMRDMVVVDSQHNKIQGRIINEDGTEGRLVTISKMSHVTKL